MKFAADGSFARLTRKLVEFISHIVAHRTKLLVLVAIGIGVLAVLTIALRRNLDSDYLNLFSQQFESVQGLKPQNTEFAASLQVVFRFLAQPGRAEHVSAFPTHFI